MSESKIKTESTWLGENTEEGFLISTLASRTAGWLDASGPQSDIIISTRIRLARNLSDTQFTGKAGNMELELSAEKIYGAVESSQTLQNAVRFEMNELQELDKRVLMERRLISPDFVECDRPAGVVIGRDEAISLMINEEDHLRIQALCSGLAIFDIYDYIANLDDEIGSQLEYAFSDHFGYLTSCPTNTGTGMRVSVFIHLPALSMAGEIEQVIRDLVPSEIAIRGFYGEGSEVMGHIFQVSNQLTLGRTEKRILDRMEQVANKLLEMEKTARTKLFENNRIVIKDKVARAKATIKSSLLIESVELVNLLSLIRIGVHLGMIENVSYKTLNELLVLMQPAHIQKCLKKKMESQQRDEIRAKMLRKYLSL